MQVCLNIQKTINIVHPSTCYKSNIITAINAEKAFHKNPIPINDKKSQLARNRREHPKFDKHCLPKKKKKSIVNIILPGKKLQVTH